jgi:hypothetical protein
MARHVVIRQHGAGLQQNHNDQDRDEAYRIAHDGFLLSRARLSGGVRS